MREHLANILNAAKISLGEWCRVNPNFCDLNRARFDLPGGYPYGERHMQSIYLLRYYAAYLAETCMLFSELAQDGLFSPVVTSFGCGSLLDAKAAQHVFEQPVRYRGYDIHDWHIKGVDINEACEFVLGDLFQAQCFPADTNVFHFPRSVGDLGERINELSDALSRSNLTSHIIYVTATCRNGIDYDVEKMISFGEMLNGYNFVYGIRRLGENIVEMYGRNGRSGIAQKYNWFNAVNDAGVVDYCRNMINTCARSLNESCPLPVCNDYVSRCPTLSLNELSYGALKYERI